MTETFRIGCQTETDTLGSRFYLLFCKALELKDVPEKEDDDPEFWETICLMGVVAWNLSFESGTEGELLDQLAAQHELTLPPSFKTIMVTLMEDRRAAFAEETRVINDCRITWPNMIIEY